MTKWANLNEWKTDQQLLEWTEACSDPTAVGDMTLSSTPLALLNAAEKDDVEAKLSELKTRIEEIHTLISNVKPT